MKKKTEKKEIVSFDMTYFLLLAFSIKKLTDK